MGGRSEGCSEQISFKQQCAPSCQERGQQAASSCQLPSEEPGLQRTALPAAMPLLGSLCMAPEGWGGVVMKAHPSGNMCEHSGPLQGPPLGWPRHCQASIVVQFLPVLNPASVQKCESLLSISYHKLYLSIFFRDPCLQQTCEVRFGTLPPFLSSS